MYDVVELEEVMTTVFAGRFGGVGRVYADFRCSQRGVSNFRTEKLFRSGGSVFGGAGCLSSIAAFRRWAEVGFDRDTAMYGAMLKILSLQVRRYSL